jgi:hypothetical protein
MRTTQFCGEAAHHRQKEVHEGIHGQGEKVRAEENQRTSHESHSGLGDAISAREDNLIVIGDEAISLGLLQILLLELRGHPAGCGVRSLPPGHLVLLCQMLHVHLRFTHGGCAGGQKCIEIATRAAAKAMNW